MDPKIRNTGTQARLPIFLALSLVAGLLLGAKMFPSGTSNLQLTTKNYLKFRDVLTYIERDYVDTVNTDELTDIAITKMLEKLDPHTSYIPVSDMALAKTYLEGDFEGIGIEFNVFSDTIVVIAPLSGGPSEAAGLKAGDKIIKVDNKNVAGIHITSQGVIELLRGPKGTKVTVTVQRRGESKPIDYIITRSKIPSISVDVAYMTDNKTGYIKVSRFTNNTYNEFKEALSKLKKRGMNRMILDLRDNPGGYMDPAVKMADDFLSGNKMIVYTDGKGSKFDSELFARTKGDFENGPLIILLNEGSASASEILAGAIQDNDRGLIVGRRSFGKGLVQMPIPLSDGSELRLTVSRYYTPSGRSIQKPYTNGLEDYEKDILKRFKQGEFFHVDSVHFADSLKFKTSKGRIVYGGGGIMPDIFVPRDTTEVTEFLSKLFGKNIIREYALNYFNDHKKDFDKMSFDKFAKSFEVSETMIQDILREAKREKIEINEKELLRSKPLIKNNVKALIARSAYGAEGFYPILHERDEEFQNALKVFDRAEKLNRGQ